MKIVISADGASLSAQASPMFGRCSAYVFVDTDSMESEGVENPAMNASGGAGIKAAQFVVERGAQAVVSGNIGPNAFGVLQAADVLVYTFGGGTVRQAVEAYKAGKLPASGGATAPAHVGMRQGRGMGMGRQAAAASPAPTTTDREEEIASLKETAGAMREQLAQVMERLDRLDKGE